MRVRPPRRTRTATRGRNAARALAVLVPLLLGCAPALALPASSPAGPLLPNAVAATTSDTPATGSAPRIALESVSPPVVTGDAPVTVTGALVNDGPTPIAASRLSARLDSSALTTDSEIDAWFGADGPADGDVVATADLPEVAPGGRAPFTLTIPRAAQFGAAPFGMTAIALDAAGLTTHTALGYQRLKEYEPLSVAVLVPVTLPADPALVGPAGTARTKAWRSALAPGSRLDRLVTLVTQPAVQAAVDPTLVGFGVEPNAAPSQLPSTPATASASPAGTASPQAEPTATPTSSPSVAPSVSPSGSPSASASATTGEPDSSATTTPSTPTSTPTSPAPGTTAEETRLRAAFASRLTSALTGTDPYLLPAADPDLAAVIDAADAPALARLRDLRNASTSAAALVEGHPDLLLPADGLWSAQREAGYRAVLDGQPGTVVVDGSSLAWNASDTAGRNAGEGLTVLSVDPGFGSFLTDAALAGATNLDPDRQQRAVAHSLATLLEAPGQARDVVVSVGRSTDPAVTQQALQLLDAIPWLRPTTVDAVQRAASQALPERGTIPEPAATATDVSPLSADHLALLGRLRTQAGVASAVRADRTEIEAGWSSRLDDLMSTRWRSDPAFATANPTPNGPAAWTQATQTLTDEIAQSTQGLRVLPQTISFLADRGRLQLTVVNELPVAVSDIRVQLTSDSPRLVVPGPSTSLSIGPASRATVTFDATAYAAGPVQLQARVLSPDGTAVGSPTSLEVNVSPTAQWVYWALGGVAVLVFLLGLVNNRRKRKGGAPTGPPSPTKPRRAGGPSPSATAAGLSAAAQPVSPDTHSSADPAALLAPDTPLDPAAALLHDEGERTAETIQADPADTDAQPDPTGDRAGSRGVARSSLVMAAGTLTSRVLGLVRATLLASIIGLTGYTADAFGVANTLPNQFYLILAGGIFNAVLVPQIVKASSHKDGGEEFVSRLVTLGIALLFVATVATTLAAPWLISLFSDFKNPQADRLATLFAYLCIPQIFFYGLYTLLGQILNARQKFGAYMWAPVVANIVSLTGLLAFLALGFPRNAPPGDWTPAMIAVLAGSATLSIAMQALFLVIPLRAMGFRYRPVWGLRGVGLGTASNVALWSFGAVVVSQLGFVVTSRVLTGATDRARLEDVVAAGRNAFDNAFLLFMLPHSLITVSLVTALFTRMAGAAHESRVADLRADLQRGLRMPAVILIPGTVYGLVFAPVLTRAFYFRNDADQTNAVASVMLTLFLGVIPFGWLYLSERFFYAHSDARTPFLIQIVVTTLATLAAWSASRLAPQFTAPGIGLGQSLAYAVGATIGFAVIRRRIGRLALGGVLTAYLRLLLPSLLAALALTAVVRLTIGDPIARGPAFCLGLAVIAGVVVLGAALVGGSLLGVPEVRDLARPVMARLRRGSRPTT